MDRVDDAVLEGIKDATTIFRKGEKALSLKTDSGIDVVEMMNYPTIGEDTRIDNTYMYDVHYMLIVVDIVKARALEDWLLTWMKGYTDQDKLWSETNYITFAARLEIGQEMAFRVFAIGEALGWWKIITPEGMGFKGDMADMLAGEGLVTVIGQDR